MDVPPALARTVTALHGEAGRRWLDALPALLDSYAACWSLELLPPFADLSYSYAAPAIRADGASLALKAAFPTRELRAEIEALRLFNGRGTVRLHAADAKQGVFLLERLEPGESLARLDDDEQATTILLGVMRRLRRPVPPGGVFPTVNDWGAGFGRLRARFGGGAGPLPPRLVEKAEALFAELLCFSDEPALLHGDLHYGNVRSAQRQPWLAIDPKGVLGEAAYEVGAFLRNPMPALLSMPDPGRILARRVDQVVEMLGFDRARVVGWGMSQAVLAAWWCLEDDLPCWREFAAVAELLDGLMG